MQLERAAELSTQSSSAGHRVHLGGDWWVWRAVCVRSTGFAVDLLEPLASRTLCEAVDAARDAEIGFDQALSQAKALVFSALRMPEADRTTLRRMLRRLSQRRIPQEVIDDALIAKACRRVRDAETAFEDAKCKIEPAWNEALCAVDRVLHSVAGANRFRAAVAWQNPAVIASALDYLRGRPIGGTDWSTRKKALLVARYLQRYCVRNDTIGFFGPVGWGKFLDDGPAIELRPGGELTDRREVHLEYWAVAALARAFERDPGLKQWLAPRLHPAVALQADTLLSAFGPHTRLPPATAMLLNACDGVTSACALAGRLVLEQPEHFSSEAAVFAELARCAASDIILWQLDVPTGGVPEVRLRRALERIEDLPTREQLLGVVREFERDLTALDAAFDDSDALSANQKCLNKRFETLTGESAAQRAGELYAGRTPVFLDCRRDLHVTFSPELRQRLGRPLAVIFDAVRWFSAQLAEQFMDFLSGLYEEITQRSGTGEIPLGLLSSALLSREPIARAVIDDVRGQLHERWEELIAPAPNDAPVRRRSAELAPRAKAIFETSGPGWPGARLHSPDILIAATSADAIRAGDYCFVFGEIHFGRVTMNQRAFQSMHPRPESLIEATQLDQPVPEIEPVRTTKGGGHRLIPDADSEIHFHLEYDDSPSRRPRDRVLRIADLLVRKQGDGLWLHTRDGSRSFPALRLFGRQIAALTGYQFSLFSAQAHRPRVWIDDLVVARESWRFTREAIKFTDLHRGYGRFAAARAFARANALPRRMFYRVPGEPKPLYLDWDSPVLVDMLTHMVRGSSAREAWVLSMSEMLPTPEQSWLTDAQGRRYTSELRLTVVDGRIAPGSD